MRLRFYLLCVVFLSLLFVGYAFGTTGQETKPIVPESGFKLVIDNGAEVAYSRNVVLLLNALNDVDRMAISTNADFKDAGIIPYKNVVEWVLPDEEAEYTIYIKVYTRFGVASPVFSDSIIYQKQKNPEYVKYYSIDGKELVAGDLFKTEESKAVYYFGYDKKRYVFPYESIFYSWYNVEDFYRVKIVELDVLSSIQIGGNIVYRPGSTLVKVRSESKVYAVGFGGTLHWLRDENVAKTLYGNNWNKKVRDIPDTLFGNYKIGDSIYYAIEPPSGFIFKEKGKPSIYIVYKNMKRPFASESAMLDNNFSTKNIVELDEVGVYKVGDLISGEEEAFLDASQKK